jgi:perosamine synthetase
VTSETTTDIPSDLRGAFEQFPFQGAEGLHIPELGDVEKAYLSDCIDSGFVSSVGAYVDRFESELASFAGAKFAVSTSSGTTALHLALLAAEVKPGDIVLVPAITFVATANAVAHCGAKAVALDVEEESMGLDPQGLSEFFDSQTTRGADGTRLHTDTGAVVRAVIAVHVLGHPCDIAAIAEVCERFGVLLLEDAAESMGSFVDGVHTGLFGFAGIFSFNGNKTITTGGGGCVVTNNPVVAERVRHLGTTARIPDPFEFDHDVVGFNYRMPNINAALGCAQLERLPGLLSAQKDLYEVYRRHFIEVESVEVVSQPEGRQSNYWLQAIRLRHGGREARDAVITLGAQLGIPLRPLWKPIPLVEAYRDGFHEEIPVATTIYDSVVCLPSSPAILRSSSSTLRGAGT